MRVVAGKLYCGGSRVGCKSCPVAAAMSAIRADLSLTSRPRKLSCDGSRVGCNDKKEDARRAALQRIGPVTQWSSEQQPIG